MLYTETLCYFKNLDTGIWMHFNLIINSVSSHTVTTFGRLRYVSKMWLVEVRQMTWWNSSDECDWFIFQIFFFSFKLRLLIKKTTKITSNRLQDNLQSNQILCCGNFFYDKLLFYFSLRLYLLVTYSLKLLFLCVLIFGDTWQTLYLSTFLKLKKTRVLENLQTFFPVIYSGIWCHKSFL